MFVAGSLIIFSQVPADSRSHIVYLCMSPAAFLSPLKKRKVRGEKKKNSGGGANKWCSVSSMQSRAELGDTIRTGHTGRRHAER